MPSKSVSSSANVACDDVCVAVEYVLLYIYIYDRNMMFLASSLAAVVSTLGLGSKRHASSMARTARSRT